MSDVAGSRTPEEQALAEEIEHTREHLGETVEALAAKADVKARAERRATEVKASLRGKAGAAKDKVTEQAGELREGAAATTARAKQLTPAPVQRSAGRAVVIVRGHRGKAAAGALAAAVVILAWLAVRRRH
jgi:Protein of unknown function (DUF3618)